MILIWILFIKLLAHICFRLMSGSCAIMQFIHRDSFLPTQTLKYPCSWWSPILLTWRISWNGEWSKNKESSAEWVVHTQKKFWKGNKNLGFPPSKTNSIFQRFTKGLLESYFEWCVGSLHCFFVRTSYLHFVSRFENPVVIVGWHYCFRACWKQTQILYVKTDSDFTVLPVFFFSSCLHASWK